MKLKLCGLSRPEDIAAANEIAPDYIGFVFWPKSRRAVTPDRAAELKALLDPSIQAVGVFVNEDPAAVAAMLNAGTIDAAQLHGNEDEAYLRRLRALTDRPIWQAFRVRSRADAARAEQSSADHILLDAGMGEGRAFDWSLLEAMRRPFFLAGGLDEGNIQQAAALRPYGVDVSSGVETAGRKDPAKMKQFAALARRAAGKAEAL